MKNFSSGLLTKEVQDVYRGGYDTSNLIPDSGRWSTPDLVWRRGEEGAVYVESGR